MTIWQLLDEATRLLPQPFTRADVLAWFAEHHPELHPPSVSAHLQAATSNAPGESKPAGFRDRRPLVTRIGWGQYVRFDGPHEPLDLTAETVAEHLTPRPAVMALSGDFRSIALVGCGRAKRDVPAPASDLYTSRGFRLRAAYAEQETDQWFVLSAEYGFVGPDEWISPYDLNLADTSRAYRRAWGEWVVARLLRLRASLRGVTIQIIAPADYAAPVRDHLEQLGAQVVEPLHGLRQFEQLSWLASRVEDPEPATPTPTRPAPGVAAATSSDAAVAEALLAYRDLESAQNQSRLGFAHSEEADALIREDPFAFLLGVVFDEGIQAERAWEAPYLLKQRLGHLDPSRMRNSPAEVRAAVLQSPTLHRYTELMPEALVAAAARVCDEYDGDAASIWSGSPTAAEVDARLQRFRRIGPKKAAMAVEMLVTNFAIDLTEHAGTNVAYDVHVRRVFLRAGLVDYDSFEGITAAARRLHPDRPGLLDLPTWLIGRRWCHPTHPQCPDCALTDVCQKRTHLNVSG
jgi:uncharacterized HhH-GPD family protein